MYQQVLDPVADSLGWSSLVAALPLAVLFVLLGGVRMRAWPASLIALAVALAVAVWTYGMPADQALLAASEGAAFGFYPILWIVINALWVYNITVATGHFDVLRRSFAQVSDDNRLQAVLIAFSFGALLEALAGFGTPVAVTSVMLIALGFPPLKAAVLALTANTAPVAFGAMATPILTLGKVTGESSDTLGAMVGRQTPILALFVPLVLVVIVDGRRGLRETWPVALLCGAAFGVAQYVTANFISVPLADVVASLVSAAAVVLAVRLRPSAAPARPAPVAGGAADEPTPEFAARVEGRDGGPDGDSRAEVARAYAPYAIIIAVFVVCQIGPVKDLLDRATRTFSWPGLHLTGPSGKPLALPTFTFNYLTTPGTQMLVAGLITMAALGVGLRRALGAYRTTLVQLRWAIITVMAVLALAFVMNASGQTVTLGTWMAGAGGAFALLSPILGWLGTAVTGSDTSSNSLFGSLQVTAANKADLSTVLMAATNSSGGVLGKMVSPQNLAIAAAAVGLDGREGDIFRRVVLWSLLFLAGMCLLSGLQSTAVLGWMVP
ncbi:L-lactate permease [Actinomadura citrea]|uniref:L-lactate permease n=1 Tax=Actinomadura citrea TaxID=46158 RepID=A0A7Y9GHF3_9ACTN|nr:L-lactate permease [Actinomadura citrea]NYE16561.1 lactate permease [Actinomadura citrea]GGT56490.1 L-lactate permease [Actinomadura citrea]